MVPVIFNKKEIKRSGRKTCCHIVKTVGGGWFITYCGMERASAAAEIGHPGEGTLCQTCVSIARKKHG